MDSKEKIITDIIDKYGLHLGENYTYVGASIIKRSVYPNYSEILYCEDNFTDENGVPYIMQSNVPNGMFDEDRMIVFYTEDLIRYIVPIDGKTGILVGNEIPENVKNIDYGKAKKIIHRKALELKRNPVKLTEEELNSMVKKYIKFYKKGRMITAGIFASLLLFILISLAVIFLMSDQKINSLGDGVLMCIFVGGIVTFIIGSIFLICFCIRLPAKRLKNCQYKSEFLVMDWGRNIGTKGLNDSHILGYSFYGDTCKLLTYGIYSYDVPFIEGVEYYEIIYRYSKSKEPKNTDYCFFTRENIK